MKTMKINILPRLSTLCRFVFVSAPFCLPHLKVFWSILTFSFLTVFSLSPTSSLHHLFPFKLSWCHHHFVPGETRPCLIATQIYVCAWNTNSIRNGKENKISQHFLPTFPLKRKQEKTKKKNVKKNTNSQKRKFFLFFMCMPSSFVYLFTSFFPFCFSFQCVSKVLSRHGCKQGKRKTSQTHNVADWKAKRKKDK